jgi:hypothetical protein
VATQADIRRQERARERRQRPISILALRLAELNRLLTARHGGEVLADDDAGRDDVVLVAHHLARCDVDPARRIASWIQLRAPWMPAGEVEQVISRVTANPLRWRADSLARRLNLTEAERRRLRITTVGAVDCDREQRAAARLARKRERDRKRAADRRAAARLLAVGRKTRADYIATALSTTKPWKAAGISRRTWERRRRRARVATPSPSIDSQYAGRHTCDRRAS